MKNSIILLIILFFTSNLFSQQVIELCEETQTVYTYWATANTPGVFYWSVNGNNEYTGESYYVNWNTIGTGSHVIQLLFDNSKCIDDKSYYVSVTDCPVTTMYAPSAFTPNYDEMNEFWRPKGENYKYFSFYIYNRWGEKIFYSGEWTLDDEKYFEGWDGVYKNETVMAGVYTYFLEWRDNRGRYHGEYGKIVLFR